MAAPSKADQNAEATARVNAGVGPGESLATQVIDDLTPGPDGPAPGALAPADDTARPAPPVRSVNDDKRNAIVSKFRTDRTKIMAEQADDISDFTRSGMPPEFTQPAVEPGDEVIEQEQPTGGAPEAVALPPTVRIKVRGEEREVTLDELIEKGQIAFAADNYLDEARSRLKSVEDLEREVRGRAPRAGQDGIHPAAPQRAQDDEPGAPAAGDPQHPEDTLGKLIESIQFGNPEEAKELLRTTIAGEARTVVNETLEQQRFKDEGARTAKVLKDFEDAHADIAQDPMARAAIEAEVLNQQVADIKALGVDPATLRPDGMPPTPGDIAQAHRWYRTKGFKVTAPADLLEKSTNKFLEWKGVKPASPQNPANPAPAQPRVDVTVDRTARRAAIPQQPNRTTAAKPAQQQQQPAKPRDRSSIVQDMIQKRSAPRGKIVA